MIIDPNSAAGVAAAAAMAGGEASDIALVELLLNSHVMVALSTVVVALAFRNFVEEMLIVVWNGVCRLTVWRGLSQKERKEKEFQTREKKIKILYRLWNECEIKNARQEERISYLEKEVERLVEAIKAKAPGKPARAKSGGAASRAKPRAKASKASKAG